MYRKRGQFILIVALEIIAAVFASYLIFSTALDWATGEAAEKFYFAKDLSMLTDALFIAPDVTVFHYNDNISKYELSFKGNALQLAKDSLDPTQVIYYFTPFRNSSIDSQVKRPPKVVLTKFGPNLTVNYEEHFVSINGVVLEEQEQIIISDPKSVSFSQSNLDLSEFVKNTIFNPLKIKLSDFEVTYLNSPSKTDNVLIIFERSDDPYAINIFYPITSNSTINKKVKRLAGLFQVEVGSGLFNPTLNPTHYLNFEQVVLSISVGDKVLLEGDKLINWLEKSLNNYFK